MRVALTTLMVLALGACETTGPLGPVETAGDVPKAGYLTAQALDGSVVLAPPPAVDSPHGRADRAY